MTELFVAGAVATFSGMAWVAYAKPRSYHVIWTIFGGALLMVLAASLGQRYAYAQVIERLKGEGSKEQVIAYLSGMDTAAGSSSLVMMIALVIMTFFYTFRWWLTKDD